MNKTIKNAFTTTVAAATIAWSIGLAAMPLAAKAAPASGSLVKASLPAVYYVGADGKRYVFPNENTYKTWYTDFTGVQVITDAELAALPIGGNVTYKPGVRMVKITTDPKVYAVDANGTLRWVTSEAAATALYGANWNRMIDDVPDAFFTNYSIGADVSGLSDFDPNAVQSAAASINVDKGLSASAGTGSLSVWASSSQASGGTLPAGATGIDVLKFDVKNNGSSALTLDSATVLRDGPGLAGDWANLYLYEGDMRVTSGRTINTTSHQAVFGGLNLSLNAGETKQMRVVADVAGAPGAGNVSYFKLMSLTAASVSATGMPVGGPNFTMTGTATVGGVTIATSSTPASPNAGELQAKVASFKLTENTGNEDIMVQKVALYYAGVMSSDNLTNLTLKQSGTTLATASGIGSKELVTFVLASPFKIEKGSSRTFEVYGDISASARPGTDNIKFYLDQSSDILAVGSVYGYGVAVTNTYGAGVTPTLAIAGGQLTITFNGPAANDIARDADDVEVFSATFAAQANLEIKTTTFSMTCVGCAAVDFSDVKLVDTATGAVVAGPNNMVLGAGGMVFNNSWYLSAGQARTLKLMLDVENSPLDGQKITAQLDAFTPSADIRNLDNNQFLGAGDFVPSANIGGNPMTIRVAHLSLSSSSTPVSQNYIVGGQGVDMMGFSLKANDASDMKVTQIVIDSYIDDDNDGNYNEGGAGVGAGGTKVSDAMLTAKLMMGTTQLGDVQSPSTTNGQITFDNLNLSIPKSSTANLKLVGNLNSSIATVTAGNPDNLAFDIALVGQVSAEDGDGNPLIAAQKSGAAFNADPDGAGGSHPPVYMAIKSAGTLSVALAPDDTETEAGLVIGGSSNAVLAKYKFTAIDEELKLVKARFSVAGASVNGISSLSLYDGSTLVGGPASVDGAGNVEFTGMNFIIPKDASKVLTVKANLNSVGATGATSGINVAVTLQDGWQTGVLDNKFEVRGTSAGSSTLIQEFGTGSSDDDIAARTKLLRKSKPTISLVSLPSSLLSTGGITVMRFTVAADAAGDVAFKSLEANLTSSSTNALTVATPNLRRVGDGTDLAGTNLASGTCNAAANTCVLNIQLTNEEVISAGTARTYDLRVNLTGTLATGDSMSTSLVGDAAQTTGVITAAASVVSVGGNPYNFVWSDISAVPHNDTLGGPSSADWTSGLYVKVLPTDSQTLSK